jgi:GDP-mannose 6-dehydrogenase
MVDVIEHLIGKGYDLRLYDRNVKLAALTGANRDYILNHIPHISKLMRENVEDVLAHADVVIIGNGDKAFADVPNRLRPGQKVIDLVRVNRAVKQSDSYEGLCW